MEALNVLVETLQQAEVSGKDPHIDFIFTIKEETGEIKGEDGQVPLLVPYSSFEEAIRQHHTLPTYLYIRTIESAYPASSAMIFRSTRTQNPYNLLTLFFYYDMVIRRRIVGGIKSYLGACKAIGLESVSFVDMKVLNAYYETRTLSTMLVEEARKLHVKPVKLSELGILSIGEKRPFEGAVGSLMNEQGDFVENGYKMARYQDGASISDKYGQSFDQEHVTMLDSERESTKIRSTTTGPSSTSHSDSTSAALSPLEKAMYGKQVQFQVPPSVPTKGLGTLIQMLKNVLRQADATVKSAVAGPPPKTASSSTTTRSASSASTTVPPSSSTSTLLPASVGPVNLQDPKSLLHHLSAITAQDATNQASSSSTLSHSISRPLRQPSTLRPATSSSITSTASSSTTAASNLPIPIILVPSAPTAILSLYNIQEFLQNEHFIPQDVARLQAPPRKPSSITIHRPSHYQRSLASLYLSPTTYLILDSPLKLQPQDWNRVVAVFVQGVTWQFKDWKYTDPLTLFTHVQGFFPFFQDPLATSQSHFPLTDPHAKLASTWNVEPLPIHKTKRHLDRECLRQFWSSLDDWMLAKGLSHFFPKL